MKLNHIDKRDIKLVFGKNGTHSTLKEKFYQVVSYSNTADRVQVSVLGNEIIIEPRGVLGHDEVFVECYQADYPNFPVTVHYWIDVEQRPGDEIKEFDEGYVAYRGVSDIYEDDGDLVMVFTNVADLGQFTIPTGLTARIDMLAVGGGGGSVHGGLGTGGAGGGGAGGQPGSGIGNGGDGGSCAQGGSGADGIVVLRMTRLFKNILVPIPTTNDFIATLRTEWTNGVTVVPFPYEDREFRSPTDMELRSWSQALEKVTGSNSVTCAWGGDGGTNKVGVGYYSFNLYLKDGYAWDDGSQYGSTEYLRYNWVITEDINNIDARVEVKKTVVWEDDSPNAIVRVTSTSSPEMSGMKVPKVLVLGSLCGAHGFDKNVLSTALNSAAKSADVHYEFYNNVKSADAATPAATGDIKAGNTLKETIKVGDSGTGNHASLYGFYESISNIAKAGTNKYDYVIFIFDRLLVATGFPGTHPDEALVAEWLKPIYEENNVIWLVDYDAEKNNHNPFVSQYPWYPNQLAFVQGSGYNYWTSLYTYEGNWGVHKNQAQEYSFQQMRALLGMFDPETYEQWKGNDNFASAKTTYNSNTITDSKPTGTTSNVNKVNAVKGNGIPADRQEIYDNAEKVGDLVASVIKVKPYDLNFADKIMSPAPGLTITGVTVQSSTNEVDWLDIITWTPGDVDQATPDGFYGSVTPHPENYATLGFSNAVMQVTTNNEVFVDMSNCTAKVVTRLDTHVHDDGTFCTSENAEYNQQTGKFEKNPNDGRARVGVVIGGTGGQGMDIDGDAETSIPWRYTAFEIRGHVNGNKGGEIFVGGTRYDKLSYQAGRDVTVYYRALGGYRLTALREDTTDHNSADELEEYATGWTFYDIQEEHDVYVTFSKFAGDAKSEPATNVYDGAAHVYPVTLVDWEDVYETEVRYATSPDAPEEEWLNEADFIATNSLDRAETCVGDHAYWYRVYAFQPGYGTIVIECPTYLKQVGQYLLMPTNAPGVVDEAIDPSGNYQLEYRPGAISVIKVPMVIGGVMQFGELDPEDPLVNTGVDRVMKTYDGEQTNITVRVDKPTGSGRGEDFHIRYSTDGETWSDVNPTFVHAGTNRVWYSVTSGPNYEESNYFYVTNYSYVIIEPAAIELTSASDAKPYDGGALIRNTVELTGGELFNGDNVVAQTTGSQTDVGTSDNTFDCSIASGDSSCANGSADYVITKKYGTLTVTPARANIDGVEHPDTPDPAQALKYGETGVRDVTMTYDGTGTNISVRVVAPATGAVVHYTTNKNDAASWQTTLSLTEVGEYIVYFAVDAANYASVTNFAKVTINPAPVTVTADDKFILEGDPQPAYTATIGNLVLRDSGREAELITYPTPTCPTYADAEGTYPIVFPEGETVERQGNYIVTFVPGTLYVDATARVGSLWITDHENLDDGTVYLAIKPTLSSGELTAETVLALAAENKIKAAWATSEEDLKSAVPQPVELRDPTGALDIGKGWIWVKVPVNLGEQAKGRPVIWTVTIDR